MTADRPLAVLHLNHTDTGHGGGAAAGLRLHRSLLAIGVDSRMAVGIRESDDPLIEEVPAWKPVKRQLRRVGWRAGLNEIEGIGALGLAARPSFRAADVVHLHALQGGWFSYPTLPWLVRDKAAVVTLHDMWPFTGHCSYSFGCERWLTGCGSCPHLDTYPAARRDATHIEWHLKRKLWARSDPTVIAPSEWLADQARRSIFGDSDVHVIPYGLDLQVFSPRDRAESRTRLGLPADTVVVLYAAASVSDRRKGADLVPPVLAAVPDAVKAACFVVLMGDRGQDTATALRDSGYRVRHLGFVSDDDAKAWVYSAADVLLFPARADNSPLVVLESLACGTPVVSFAVGGIPEDVRDGETGRVVAPNDLPAMTAALAEVVVDQELQARLRPRCRAIAEERHDLTTTAVTHRWLYEEKVGGGHRSGPRGLGH